MDGELPLAAPCVLTYLHFTNTPLSIEDGLRWAPLIFGKNASRTVSAVVGRYRRLSVKVPAFLSFDERGLCLKTTLPPSPTCGSEFIMNRSIVEICLTRLTTCFAEKQLNVDNVVRPSIGGTSASQESMLRVLRKQLESDYRRRKERLQLELDELENNWENPLKSVQHLQSSEGSLQQLDPDEETPLETDRPSKIASGSNKRNDSLFTFQRKRIREAWKEGSEGAIDRVIEANLTAHHVSWHRVVWIRTIDLSFFPSIVLQTVDSCCVSRYCRLSSRSH
jgi:hypothetical protein